MCRQTRPVCALTQAKAEGVNQKLNRVANCGNPSDSEVGTQVELSANRKFQIFILGRFGVHWRFPGNLIATADGKQRYTSSIIQKFSSRWFSTKLPETLDASTLNRQFVSQGRSRQTHVRLRN